MCLQRDAGFVQCTHLPICIRSEVGGPQGLPSLCFGAYSERRCHGSPAHLCWAPQEGNHDVHLHPGRALSPPVSARARAFASALSEQTPNRLRRRRVLSVPIAKKRERQSHRCGDLANVRFPSLRGKLRRDENPISICHGPRMRATQLSFCKGVIGTADRGPGHDKQWGARPSQVGLCPERH